MRRKGHSVSFEGQKNTLCRKNQIFNLFLIDTIALVNAYSPVKIHSYLKSGDCPWNFLCGTVRVRFSYRASMCISKLNDAVNSIELSTVRLSTQQ